MAAIVRLKGLRALALLITAAIPALRGKICVGVAPPGEAEHYPNLSMQPTRWTYEPEQAAEQLELPGNVLVLNVGRHSSPMVISIVTANIEERAELEQRVLDLFLSSKDAKGYHRPGVVVAPVTSCRALGEWVAAFELESDEWNDANAFDRIYESKIIVTALIPALVIERNVFSILELQLALTQDMATTFTPSTAIPPAVDLVTINADGSLTPA